MKYKADIVVILKKGIRDPKGNLVETVLSRLGIDEQATVSVGKFFSLVINAEDESMARAKLEIICQNVLSNPVLESYKVERFILI